MAKSLQQFREWAIKVGSTGNPSGGSYHGECVSLIQQYINQVFGIPYVARGHAAWYTPPASHFKQVPVGTKLKPGDIIRYGTNYGWGYGHIGMIDDRGTYLDQNGVRARAIGTRSVPFADIRAVFRPTRKFNVKTPSPKRKTNDQVANEIVAGKGGWGNGVTRIAKLTAAGYNASAIQKLVNQKMAAKTKKPLYVTVKRNWGLSNVAKAAGYSDWGKSTRWAAIARLNGSSNWQLYNRNLRPGQKVRVK